MNYHAHIYWKNSQERDHTEGARWIGGPLELDLVFLQNFQDD